MFRQFGSRLIVNGRRVKDDYWEQKARKQGFTEEDLAEEKRPGAAKARDAAAAEASALANMTSGHHGNIVYSNSPAHFGSSSPTASSSIRHVGCQWKFHNVTNDHTCTRAARHASKGL